MVDNPDIRTICTLIGLAALAGCAASSDRYPTLEIRDVERVQGSFEPVQGTSEVELPAPLPADSLDRLTQLTSQADDAHREFLSSVPRTSELVNSSQDLDPESNAWATAQIALAHLDSLRSQTATSLGDLDLIYADASTTFVQRTQIDDARQKVVAKVQEQDRILARLRGDRR